MESRFDLIVFDWDGTLLDSAAAIVQSIQAACLDLGVEPPDDDRARQVIGLGLHDALGRAVPELNPGDYLRLAARYRFHYLSQDRELKLFPGAARLVRELHGQGYRLGVATGKTRFGLDRAMAHAGLESCFHVTRCADECAPKPDPSMLLYIMDETGASPSRTLMVGDTTHDLRMARSASVAALAVTFGAHRREDLVMEQPLGIAESIAELARWLERNG